MAGDSELMGGESEQISYDVAGPILKDASLCSYTTDVAALNGALGQISGEVDNKFQAASGPFIGFMSSAYSALSSVGVVGQEFGEDQQYVNPAILSDSQLQIQAIAAIAGTIGLVGRGE